MSYTEIFFIQILQDYLNQSCTIVPEYVDWNELILLSKKHDVGGIIYHQLKKNENLNSLASTYYFTVCKSSQRSHDFEYVKNEFKENNIPFIIVKGPIIANYYPIPELRTMSDIDLLIHLDYKEKICDVMKKLGYIQKGDSIDRDLHFYNNTIYFEMHPYLIYDDEIVEKKVFSKFFSNYWDYKENDSLNINYHFLYVLVHLRKHLLIEGAGFRQFMDVAVMMQKAELSWDWIIKKLQELDLYVFAKNVFLFIDKWFGFKSPINGSISDELFEFSTRIILDNGVFGHQSVGAKNAMKAYNSARGKGTSTAIQLLFPSYNVMRRIDCYNYIDGKKYLLPISWIHRFFYEIKHKKDGIEKLKNSVKDGEQVEERSYMIKEWGLL